MHISKLLISSILVKGLSYIQQGTSRGTQVSNGKIINNTNFDTFKSTVRGIFSK